MPDEPPAASQQLPPLAAYIQRHRFQLGMTAHTYAEHVGISEKTYHRIVSQGDVPTMNTLTKMGQRGQLPRTHLFALAGYNPTMADDFTSGGQNIPVRTLMAIAREVALPPAQVLALAGYTVETTTEPTNDDE